jgi:hypothetical protein
MARKPYTMDSIGRALDHHVKTGAIESYRRPAIEREAWVIVLPQFSTVELTTAQTYGMCLGLAAAEKNGQRKLRGKVQAATDFLTRRREENRRLKDDRADRRSSDATGDYHDGYSDGYNSGAIFAYDVSIKECELFVS